ncbi:hypothetical protein PGQ11_007964 [Apiospora arundinis]|uniref:Uncharacterized protein n=1 Tax=Apiospora arundinis TaxID=335852 RepID=A0ABR2IXT1_9PEZI
MSDPRSSAEAILRIINKFTLQKPQDLSSSWDKINNATNSNESSLEKVFANNGFHAWCTLHTLQHKSSSKKHFSGKAEWARLYAGLEELPPENKAELARHVVELMDKQIKASMETWRNPRKRRRRDNDENGAGDEDYECHSDDEGAPGDNGIPTAEGIDDCSNSHVADKNGANRGIVNDGDDDDSRSTIPPNPESTPTQVTSNQLAPKLEMLALNPDSEYTKKAGTPMMGITRFFPDMLRHAIVYASHPTNPKIKVPCVGIFAPKTENPTWYMELEISNESASHYTSKLFGFQIVLKDGEIRSMYFPTLYFECIPGPNTVIRNANRKAMPELLGVLYKTAYGHPLYQEDEAESRPVSRCLWVTISPRANVKLSLLLREYEAVSLHSNYFEE